jgi:Ca2+-binding RTX toxin-like protein
MEDNMGLPRIEGDDFDNILDGTINAEEIRGDRGNDTIRGFGGNDRLRGDKGNDIIDGGDGNDRLRGDAGDDILTGGAGRDRFTFNNRGGKDTVTDFTNGEDRLDFTNFNIVATAQDSAFTILMSKADQVGSDVVFTMDGGEVFTLQNVDIAMLDVTDFRI